VNPILAGVAFAVVAGSVAAVSTRDARSATLAIALVLVVSPLVADPLAAPAGLAARLVGGVLAAYLMWIVVRDRPESRAGRAETGGSRIGWPAEILVAAAAAVVGYSAHGLGAPALGPALASAAGFAVAALAVAPVITGRDVLRVGIGLLLLTDAGLLVRAALGGTPGPLEQLLSAALLAGLGGALAMAAQAARLEPPGGFEMTADLGRRARREPDAHPMDAR
jgi:hypothetical protein